MQNKHSITISKAQAILCVLTSILRQFCAKGTAKVGMKIERDVLIISARSTMANAPDSDSGDWRFDPSRAGHGAIHTDCAFFYA